MKIAINSSSINYVTDKAYLISIPKTDYQFWLSDRCCYKRLNYGYNIYINPDYDYYTAHKHSRSKGKISGDDLINHFDGYKVYDHQQQPKVIRHVPEKVPAEETIHIDSSLLRGENDE